MWQAFIEEFPLEEYPNIVFINKISIPFGANHGGMRDWKHRIPKDPRIGTINGFLPDINDFYRSLDCYCSPTAGEGYGLTLAEAMACNIPTIGSRHSGNLDFMTDENSYLVDVDDWSYVGDDPTNYLEHLVCSWQQWKLPKVESIRAQMRLVYDEKMNNIEHKKNHILEQYTVANTVAEFKEALATVGL